MQHKFIPPEVNDPDWLREQCASRSPREIAESIGVHPTTIYQRIAKFGILDCIKSGPPVVRACERCGVTFSARHSVVKSGGGKYCSKSCQTGTPEQRFRALFSVSESGCWEWTGCLNHAGYGLISYEKRSFLAHRLSWILHNEQIPDGMNVCHHCDNPPCVNPAHLFLGEDAANVADKVSKGRQRHGETHQTAKLTLADVQQIRADYAAGIASQHELARRFSVHQTTIHGVVRGKRWRHV